MRIDTTDKTKCCGCGACAVVCPKVCIKMQSDDEGFLYPRIDLNSCIDCGACLAVCGMQSRNDFHKVINTYAAWHTDKQIRAKGTSGSVFNALAHITFGSGGVVAGAVFSNDFKSVKHVIAESLTEADRFYGSKYVQSETPACFGEIVEKVDAGKKVLFGGTPCQVASLRKLAGDASGLVSCDIVCHGVPSPKVFRSYISELEEKQGAALVAYSFRDKKNGWNFPKAKMEFINQSIKRVYPWADRFMTGFYKGVFLRPCCYTCPFAASKRVGDLTLADCWRVATSHPQYDDNKGTSLVLVNTEKGQKLLQQVYESGLLFLGEYTLELACSRNTPLREAAKISNVRDAFFKRFNETGSCSQASMAYVKYGFMFRKRIEQCVKQVFWFILRRFQ